MNEYNARQLAQEYARSGKRELDAQFFPIDNTDDGVLVIVVRVPARRREYAVKSIEEATRSFTPTASGTQCPRCGGTGRI